MSMRKNYRQTAVITSMDAYTGAMGKALIFANQKGGVGKTTTAVNLASYIADAGKRVLLVDFDPQGNMTLAVGGDRTKPGVYEWILKKRTAKEVVQKTVEDRLYIIPANVHLSGINVELADMERREFFLREALGEIKKEFDYVFIDSPPSLDLVTVNGLAAADLVMIPLQTEFFAIEGTSQLVRTITMVKQNLNPGLELGGIILTMKDNRTQLSKNVVDEALSYFKDKVFRTAIPRNVSLAEAPSFGMTIRRYQPLSPGGRAYELLAKEVMERVK